jgi:hypothetical protein
MPMIRVSLAPYCFALRRKKRSELLNKMKAMSPIMALRYSTRLVFQ